MDRNDDMAFENVISNGYSLKEKFWNGLHSNLEQKNRIKIYIRLKIKIMNVVMAIFMLVYNT